MGKVIAVMCHKGGAGKTTTVNSLAGYYAQRGNKVLIIDADEQANIKTLFGMRLSNADGGLASILISNLMPESMIQKTPFENIDVILSGGRKMKDFEETVFQRPDRYNIMSSSCKKLRDIYDIILIDTPPAIGAISVNVVAFADYALLVSEPDLLGAIGARATEQFISKEVGTDMKLPCPKILGVAFTRFDARRSADHNAFDEMDTYASKGLLGGGKVYEPIRQDSKIRTAQARRKTIFHYAPNSNGAIDYVKLGEQILNDIAANEKPVIKSKLSEVIL
jgi:chromosome partitioning protein